MYTQDYVKQNLKAIPSVIIYFFAGQMGYARLIIISSSVGDLF